ncbi:tetratricopeptide repeat protein [Methanolacinia paynteri]|uniref:tetratricopeptide repeat protein n=1 Tax=Methanolacinia paynteri TaxID=230356 RepID=UPI000694940D|nr:tetratricopeptide repeat protein [Methanolacinia paynteri]
MSTIRIQEFSGDDDQNAKVIFDNSTEYPVSIHNPFSKKEEKRLEWYFEEHFRYPFTDEEQADQAVNSIQHYGERLFNQIFSEQNEDVYNYYKNITKDGIGTILFEIVGSPSFHAIHWEALKDPKHSKPFSLESSMVRKNVEKVRKNDEPPLEPYTIRPSPTLNILVVTARPYKHRDAGYRTVSRPLVELIEKSQLPVKIDILRPRTYKALSTHLKKIRNENNRQGYYHIIHFDTHGALLDYDNLRQLIQKEHRISLELFQKQYGRNDIERYNGFKAFMFFESMDGEKADYVEASELADLLKLHQIPIAVLNACQSGKQVGASETSLGSYLAQTGTQLVVAMSYSITVSAAEILMERLYKDLFDGKDGLTAVRSGRLELYNHKGRQADFNLEINLEDWLLPVVYQNQDVDLRLGEFTPEERAEYDSERANAYPFPTPEFGFFGRDIDILAIEDLLFRTDSDRLRRVLWMLKTLLIEGHLLRADGDQRRNILMIRGLGGAGKTTLLKHLGAWWQKTRFVDDVAYFGYDEGTWTCDQIVDDIARKVLGDARYYAEFDPLKPVAQQQMIVDILRLEPHLLILDNFESVTSDVTTTQNALSPGEQEALRAFLTKLAGGKTCIMIGTRGREDWLIGDGGPLHPDDVYDLPGLDREAASSLVDRILERNKIDKGYLEDEDFNTILKLLDGYPMAMEVILPNLKSRKPTEVLDALKEGDITLDRKGVTGRTESLIQSVEYSFSNLPEDQQDVLLCLAPFTSVIHKNILEIYIKRLCEQPATTQLTFENIREVIDVAADWGLLRQNDQLPGLWKLQPILPYFLRSRLKEKKSPEIQDAINTAFVETYYEAGSDLSRKIDSKEAHERKSGLDLVHLEYENLLSALNLALERRGSIVGIYGPISEYLDARNRHVKRLALGEYILNVLRKYPFEDLNEQIAIEIIGISDEIGRCQLDLKKIENSRKSCNLALKMLKDIQHISEDEKLRLSANIYHQLGRVAQEQRKWEQAEKCYKKALEICEEFNDRYEQAKIYHQLGRVAQEQRKWKETEKYYKTALEIDLEFNDRHEQAKTYHQLGIVAQEQRRLKQAEKYYRKALEIDIEFNDRYEQAKIYHNIGFVAQEQQKWEQAEKYYKTALEIDIELNNRYEQASTYHQLGNVAQEQRKWKEAEQYYRKALEIDIEFNNRYEQASTYHQLGIVAQEQQKWKEAEKYYRKALEVDLEFNDRYEQASTYHQLGMVAQKQQKWEQAEQYYRKALEIFEEFNDHYTQAKTYHQLGFVAQEQQKLEQAEKYYKTALGIFKEFNDRFAQAKTYHQLGRLEHKQQQWEQAEKYYKEALNLEFNDHYGQASTYHQLGIVAQEQRKWGQAEEYYKRALEIKIEFDDHYEQALTYHELGRVAQEQKQWEQAEKYYKKALEVFLEFKDLNSMAVTLLNLSLLWKETENDAIPRNVSETMGISLGGAKELLEKANDRLSG